MDKHIHIVSLDVPWPANYGGVMDIFYKLKHLSNIGFSIHLHCFTSGRKPQAELEKYCRKIDYYPRKKCCFSFTLPYIVQSRSSKKLIENLKKDQYPILMEGVHCSVPVWEKAFSNRKLLIRLHNIEHIYYNRLAGLEKNFFRKKYYELEAKRLLQYERKLANKAILLPLNRMDENYFQNEFGARRIQYLPVFTPWDVVESVLGKSDYCLYHGNLQVNENEAAAIALIEHVFSQLDIKFIIAGANPSSRLKKMVDQYAHIELYTNPGIKEMETLIRDAHIHVLPSLNETGIKLKLLHALFIGRFCIVNTAAVAGSSLATICSVAEDYTEMKTCIEKTMQEEFTLSERSRREELLKLHFNNEQQARKFSDWLL